MNAEDRAWEVVRRAFEEREPARPAPHAPRVGLVVAALAVALAIAAASSSPGHAVFERVKRAVGVENAARRLGALPAPGRLLVVSAEGGGAWIVDPDGATQRLGDWDDASWSPHGLYVAVAGREGLAAVDPHGTVRWRLARPDAAWPVWEGSRTDTRIAYFSRGALRVVAGDGTDDRLLDAHAAAEKPAWDPARTHVLAYESGGAVVLRPVDGGAVLWRTDVPVDGSLAWSSDGRRLAVVAPSRIVVLDGSGRVLRTVRHLPGESLEAAFQPGTHALTISLRRAGRSSVESVDVDRPARTKLLFAGPGVFGDLAWSPDGRWLLVDWPTADQWVFLHGRDVRAVANIARQFPRPDGKPPLLELASGWCCPADHGSR